MALERYATLGGVALHYDRFSRDQYGTEGIPFRPLIETSFAEGLAEAFKAISKLFKPKLGALEIAVSGGVGREGVGASLHHQNRAFDLDGLIFEKAHFVAGDFPDEPHFYLAVEAVLRRHFGLVLAYDYNPAHEDHLHIDDSRTPGFRRDARSHTIFVQNLLTYVYDVPVLRDGVWGPQTEAVHRDLREELGVGPFSRKECWLTFCQHAAEHALERLIQPPRRRLYG